MTFEVFKRYSFRSNGGAVEAHRHGKKLYLTRKAVVLLGDYERVQLFFDRDTKCIALKPGAEGYKLSRKGILHLQAFFAYFEVPDNQRYKVAWDVDNDFLVLTPVQQ